MVPPDERDTPRPARNRRAPVPLVRLDGRWWNRGELFPLPAPDDIGGPRDLAPHPAARADSSPARAVRDAAIE